MGTARRRHRIRSEVWNDGLVSEATPDHVPAAHERLTVGWREWVHLPILCADEPIKAKVDTGARTSAIHAWNVEEIDVDGVTRVRFGLHPRQRDDAYVITAEADLVEWRDIRSSNGDDERRPVIMTELALGGISYPIELTLTDRDRMGFRMLLGRTAMADRLVVDPGGSHLLGPRPTVGADARHGDGR